MVSLQNCFKEFRRDKQKKRNPISHTQKLKEKLNSPGLATSLSSSLPPLLAGV